MKNPIQTSDFTHNPEDEGPVVLHPNGPLDKTGSTKLVIKLLSRLAGGCRKIIIDLRRVPYIDSDGIRTILGLLKEYADVVFEVRNANQKILRTLSLLHLDNKLLFASG
ncbi:MAG: STAS domain-containing protein [Armatimonadota bacterium]